MDRWYHSPSPNGQRGAATPRDRRGPADLTYAPAVRPLLLALLLACSGPPYVPVEPAPLADDPWRTDSGIDPGDLPCSGADTTPAVLEVDNQSDADVVLYWRNTACNETEIGPLPAGEQVTHTTAVSHAWVARDAVDGTAVDWWTVTSTEQAEVIE